MLERAFAKINLGLDIVGKRPDGYHEVNMVMQSIALADEVELLPAEKISVTTDNEDIPDGKDNLAWKAAMLLAETYGHKPNVQIHIRKHIFSAAGLAGGSADAAAVLRGLNRLWQLGLNADELEVLAAELGSDVPFCIRGGTAAATGRGEILEPLADMPETWVVLAKPKVSVSTAWAYQNFRNEEVSVRPDIIAMKKAVKNSDKQEILASMGNVLESVTCKAYPEIDAIKETMMANGAEISLMSGSGPTVFCFVDSEAGGRHIAAVLRENFTIDIELTKTLRRNNL
ncbi:MAG: 4-(cytidine 5'-diphospho)-2-C-methyl-D-erythritol kinase [Acholeplasmataceae bacterium]|nr:4-(cytidine 5'-diphospho)-2-C-methyl-D-erythritol kinase [Acholeplasmataceae bacterium]